MLLSLLFIGGFPDVDNLILFCNQYLGWPPDTTTQLLKPILDRARSGARQTRITSFMRYEDGIKFAEVRSKRLRDVLKKHEGTSSPAKKGKQKKSEASTEEAAI
jgi:hypothetical protein